MMSWKLSFDKWHCIISVSSIRKRAHQIMIIQNLISVNCTWSAWKSWNDCSASCGGGTQLRYRIVELAAKNGGLSCEGIPAESQACNLDLCPPGNVTNISPFWASLIELQDICIISSFSSNLELSSRVTMKQKFCSASSFSQLHLVPMDPMGQLLNDMWSWDTIAIQIYWKGCPEWWIAMPWGICGVKDLQPWPLPSW